MLYLLVKIHKETGLKYLCKHEANSIAECERYKGSGTYWKRHIKKYGNNVDTFCIVYTDDKDYFTQQAKFHSNFFNIIESNEWANLVNEEGQGGNTVVDKTEHGKKTKKWWNSLSNEERNNVRTKISTGLNALSTEKKQLWIEKIQKNRNKAEIYTKVANKLKGVPKTEDHKKAMRGERPSVNQKGSSNNFTKSIRTPFGVFGSLKEASEKLNIKYANIWYKVNSKNNEWSYK